MMIAVGTGYITVSERRQTPLPIYIIKMKIHSSCEIEDSVETHLCNTPYNIIKSFVSKNVTAPPPERGRV